jgi:hypothetical protein
MAPMVGRIIDQLGAWPSLMATNACGIVQSAASTFLPLALQPIAFGFFGPSSTTKPLSLFVEFYVGCQRF